MSEGHYSKCSRFAKLFDEGKVSCPFCGDHDIGAPLSCHYLGTAQKCPHYRREKHDKDPLDREDEIKKRRPMRAYIIHRDGVPAERNLTYSDRSAAERAMHNYSHEAGVFTVEEISTVDHPAHYGGDTPYEVIKVLEAWLTPEQFEGFLIGNVIKYDARARHKGGDEDLAKAAWYQNYLVEWKKRKAT